MPTHRPPALRLSVEYPPMIQSTTLYISISLQEQNTRGNYQDRHQADTQTHKYQTIFISGIFFQSTQSPNTVLWKDKRQINIIQPRQLWSQPTAEAPGFFLE